MFETVFFQNAFGSYTYHRISANCMFGYELKKFEGQVPFVIQMATPEKAILDLLHLYPEYSTAEDMLNLRLNEDFMESEIDQKKLLEYEKQIQSPALTKRVNLLREHLFPGAALFAASVRVQGATHPAEGGNAGSGDCIPVGNHISEPLRLPVLDEGRTVLHSLCHESR
jgi:hypothetical protein